MTYLSSSQIRTSGRSGIHTEGWKTLQNLANKATVPKLSEWDEVLELAVHCFKDILGYFYLSKPNLYSYLVFSLLCPGQDDCRGPEAYRTGCQSIGGYSTHLVQQNQNKQTNAKKYEKRKSSADKVPPTMP